MACRCIVLISLALASAWTVVLAQTLSPRDVFRQIAPSVVVVEVLGIANDRSGKPDISVPPQVLASGSGVVIPSRDKGTLIVTNCHLVDQPRFGFRVRQGDVIGIGYEELVGRDRERDLCTLRVYEANVNAPFTKALPLPAARIASSDWLEVGDPVFAVGAPEGLELTLSNGLVSGFREYEGTSYIQTTAPISKGSSGGGLFDAQGRLVGITTMYVKDGQALNFAVPAELIASIPAVPAMNMSGAVDRAAAEAADQAAADAALADMDSGETSAAGTTGFRAAPAVQSSPPRSEQRAESTPPSISEASAAESRWMYVAVSTDGGVVYLDSRTTLRSGSDVTVWWKVEYGSPQVDGFGDTFDEVSKSSIIHCQTRQMSDLVLAQRLNGKVIFSREWKSYEVKRKRVQPDTIGEELFDVVCNL